jgi:hypothetical protein
LDQPEITTSKITALNRRARLHDVREGFLPVPLACEQQRAPQPWISRSTSTRIEGCSRLGLGTGAAPGQVEETGLGNGSAAEAGQSALIDRRLGPLGSKFD